MSRARAAAALVTYALALVAQLALPLIAHAETNITSPEQLMSISRKFVEELAITIAILGIFGGIIMHILGRGPQLLERVLFAVGAGAAVTYIVMYIFSWLSSWLNKAP